MCMPPSFFPVSPSPSPLSRVISLSYVCPSLCVCVPPLFVSDSFSREIRDAYLVPLFSTGAAAPSYAAPRWPRHEKRHIHPPCTLRDLIGVGGGGRCRISWHLPTGKCGQVQASTCIAENERFIDRLTLFNVLRKVIKSLQQIVPRDNREAPPSSKFKVGRIKPARGNILVIGVKCSSKNKKKRN